MRKFFSIISLAALGASFVAPALAEDRGTAAEATTMVKKATALIKSKGKEQAFADISNKDNKDFHYKDLYIFVYDLNGNSVAHGNNPKMVGKNLKDLKDNDGKPVIKEMIDLANAKGTGWVDYKWPNPVTKAVEQKSSYIEKLDNLIVGAGIYKN